MILMNKTELNQIEPKKAKNNKIKPEKHCFEKVLKFTCNQRGFDECISFFQSKYYISKGIGDMDNAESTQTLSHSKKTDIGETNR